MINKIKGTKDFSVTEMMLKDFILTSFENVVTKHEFKMVETPILEQTSLFKRSVGESEIAKKEMYEFMDKGDREICLRPEGTASFVRAYIENKWYADDFDRFAYFGPMFRYEQPQKGRYRQFYQAGVEFVGGKNYLRDAEVILTAVDLLDLFNVEYELKINSIGDTQSRANYEQALYDYLIQYKDQLSEISQERLANKKVLRILDDKNDAKKDFMKNIPLIQDYLSEESKQYFENVLKTLANSDVKFSISNELVRGLDYYDEVVFEFASKDKNAGSQATLIGGGRYSNLIHELGGPKVSSVGFGFGVDRLIDLIKDEFNEVTHIEQEARHTDIYIAMSEDAKNIDYAFWLANNHLRNFFTVEVEYELIKSKKLMDKAYKHTSQFIIYDDKMAGDDLLTVKSLVNKDKISFGKNIHGIADLFTFLIENVDENAEVDINEIEEYLSEELMEKNEKDN
ncbi:histidine--tRNA ligase [Mycoplasmopsis verecunda]|uniref:Histidine--tRNA ligase n=1 Tax=Mycoplasmopsis verecunda TaxID=171291 RepID=A0A1T4KY37_9BACT|nr:histidine--tRNA ligase [Mycoplasmopsis verecunda]WPB54343.1 histidine--tRNA ligase [Mycoplasmopsis verecunda]SJZ47375.1 histidyl-tRNA synthetase [Mycoplasmopsis verecunda]